jgi:ABC-type glycerol-3-phosphate transport system substrate-binding protein
MLIHNHARLRRLVLAVGVAAAALAGGAEASTVARDSGSNRVSCSVMKLFWSGWEPETENTGPTGCLDVS